MGLYYVVVGFVFYFLSGGFVGLWLQWWVWGDVVGGDGVVGVGVGFFIGGVVGLESGWVGGQSGCDYVFGMCVGVGDGCFFFLFCGL